MSEIITKEEILFSSNCLERAILEVCERKTIEDIMKRKRDIKNKCKNVMEVWREYIKNETNR